MAKNNNNASKKMAEVSIALNVGLVALIFSTQFFSIQPNIIYAVILVIFGLAGIIWGVVKWKRM